MILHENQKIFNDKIKATAEAMKTEPFYIEKDYWVTYMLKKIAHSEFKDNISFKGGTSLSKAYNMIHRFSEDVDLRIYDGDKIFGGGTAKRLYKSIESVIGDDSLTNQRITNRGDALREQRFEFKNSFANPSDEILPYVKLEQNYQSSYLPMEQREIESYVGLYIKKESPKLYVDADLGAFSIATLSPKVTFAEKIGALEDYYHKGLKDGDFSKLLGSVRHFYDLHMMMHNDYFSGYLDSDEFIENLLKKRENDIKKFLPEVRREEKLQETHYGFLIKNTIEDCPIFFNLSTANNDLFEKLRDVYNNSFSLITFNELPEFDEVVNSLNVIGSKIVASKSLLNLSSIYEGNFESETTEIKEEASLKDVETEKDGAKANNKAEVVKKETTDLGIKTTPEEDIEEPIAPK